ncbi:MAG: hypothetical protein U5M51_04025 [Emticicia sp.]|nr:hypothetical protein [Emticicia sp.]
MENDIWKLKEEIKALKKRIKELGLSRDMWKQKTLSLKSEQSSQRQKKLKHLLT